MPGVTSESAWFENAEFWQAFECVMFPNERIERAAAEVDSLLQLAEIDPQRISGQQALDLCCGPGRHAVELARRGFTVTGVDRTASYLERAKERATEQGVKIEFVESDMRTFVREEAFELAVNLFTSFGYFIDQRDDEKVLANLHASLRPGGRLVMELMGKEVLARIFQPQSWYRIDDQTIMLEEHRISRHWSWITNTWMLVRDGRMIAVHTFEHRIYSAAELEALLAKVGFQSIEIFGTIEGEPYDHTAKRLVVTARKRE